MGNHQIESKKAMVENRLPQLTDWVQIDYLDTSEKLVCILPLGAVILDVLSNVITAFDDTSTDYIVVGDGSTEDLFADDLDVSSTGMKAESQNTTPVVPAARLTAETFVYAKYNGANGNAAAGVAQVSVLWAPSFRKDLDT